MISIIIPHYNSWEKLRELIMTIPHNSNIQIIIIDDNSEDKYNHKEKLIKDFPYILLIANNSGKKGAGAARNVGLNYATGKWLLFADADDLFVENSFKKIEKYLDLDYDIIYFKPSSFHENSEKKSSRHKIYESIIQRYLKDKNYYNELQLRYKFVTPTSKLIRHSIVVNNCIYFEETIHANDILFSAKVGYYSNEILATDKNIYSIRESEESLTKSVNDNSFRQRFDAWMKYDSFIKKHINIKDYKLLNSSAMFQLGRIYTNKLSISNYFYVIKECIKNDISLVDKNILNFGYVYSFFKK